eukprot:jgi/Botrbrau1/7411/Bobra.0112s0011.1
MTMRGRTSERRTRSRIWARKRRRKRRRMRKRRRKMRTRKRRRRGGRAEALSGRFGRIRSSRPRTRTVRMVPRGPGTAGTRTMARMTTTMARRRSWRGPRRRWRKVVLELGLDLDGQPLDILRAAAGVFLQDDPVLQEQITDLLGSANPLTTADEEALQRMVNYVGARETARTQRGALPRDTRAAGGGGRVSAGEAGAGLANAISPDGTAVCSYARTSNNFVDQHWYFCYTCNLLDSKGCCSVCVAVCHKGHDVAYSGRSRFFCDCGARAGGSRAVECRCLQPVHVDLGRQPEPRVSSSAPDALTSVGDAFFAARQWLPDVAMAEGIEPSFHIPQESIPGLYGEADVARTATAVREALPASTWSSGTYEGVAETQTTNSSMNKTLLRMLEALTGITESLRELRLATYALRSPTRACPCLPCWSPRLATATTCR